MKTILKILGGLIVVVIAVIVAVPMFVDLEDLAQPITRGVESATGRELNIDGDMSLAVFPSLALELNQVRLANMESVQANRHATCIGSAFFVQNIKLVDDHVAEGFRRHAQVQERRDIVELDRVRHRDQIILGRIETERMIVSGVVTQILHAILFKQARGVVGVRQER